MRERKVLLPGVTTLASLVARVRDDTTHSLWRVLEALLTPAQRRMLDRLLEVPPGLRVSNLERWRKGPPPRGSGPAIIQALDQVAEIQGLGLAGLGAEAVVPPRRLGELARYGMTVDAWLIRRHPGLGRDVLGGQLRDDQLVVAVQPHPPASSGCASARVVSSSGYRVQAPKTQRICGRGLPGSSLGKHVIVPGWRGCAGGSGTRWAGTR